MKSKLFYSFLFLLFLGACGNNENDRSDSTKTTESDVDAARNFIRTALDGRYDKLDEMVVPDSTNLALVEVAHMTYQSRMSPEDKRGYRESSINIHNVQTLNDSTTIVTYSNSYKKTKNDLKVLQRGSTWLVDFKYSFPTDSTANQ
ncbi:MAG: hypothetical protein ACO1NX_10470 [Chitinophagaceae bacterium]